MLETLKPPLEPAVVHRIDELSGGILPLQRILTQIATVNGLLNPEDLDALLPPVTNPQEVGLGGYPEKLFHTLSPDFYPPGLV